jgi:hypothetical protein
MSDKIPERMAFLKDMVSLKAKIPTVDHQLWMGDWNGDVGGRRDTQNVNSDSWQGPWGMARASTSSGTQMGEWCQEHGLKVADSFFVFPCRGTWRHVQTKQWYELDYFMATPGLLKRIVRISTRAVEAYTDHLAKELRSVLGSSRSSKSFRHGNALDKPRLRIECILGSSAEAVNRRLAYTKLVGERCPLLSQKPTWREMASLLVKTTEDTVGRGGETRFDYHSKEAADDRQRMSAMWEGVRTAQGTNEEHAAAAKHKDESKQCRAKWRRWVWERVEGVAKDMQGAAEGNDVGKLYMHMKRLSRLLDQRCHQGQDQIDLSEARRHMLGIGGKANDVEKEVLRRLTPHRQPCVELGAPPGRDAVLKNISKMRGSAGGQDEVRIEIVKNAPEEFRDAL